MPLSPATAEAFARNVRTVLDHVRSTGATPVVLTMPWNPARIQGPFVAARVEATREHNRLARELAAERDYPLLDLAEEADDALRAEFVDLIHFSPAGNARKAEWIADELLERGILSAAPGLND